MAAVRWLVQAVVALVAVLGRAGVLGREDMSARMIGTSLWLRMCHGQFCQLCRHFGTLLLLFGFIYIEKALMGPYIKYRLKKSIENTQLQMIWVNWIHGNANMPIQKNASAMRISATCYWNLEKLKPIDEFPDAS
uniref:DUF4220 domain-containing protein n=1 Tax=Oryza rufipogon TaxID=4529 RepID=A0A0E0Q6C8_ORYRU